LSADDIRALVERLRTAVGDGDAIYLANRCTEAGTALATLLSQVKTLTLENQRLRLDAQRYRWLRNEANKEPAAAPFVFFCDPNLPLRWVDAIYGEQLDADIDAARAQIDKERP
jgi:hypothetical protein